MNSPAQFDFLEQAYVEAIPCVAKAPSMDEAPELAAEASRTSAAASEARDWNASEDGGCPLAWQDVYAEEVCIPRFGAI